MDERLTERKKKVLQALIDRYITSVEPISSGDIQKKYLPDVSPATIRSELSHLEEMGYLIKPHISAGRVPSSKAYRYYVENFISDEDIDLEQLRKNISQNYDSVVEIVRNGAKIVSDVTNYTSMLMIANSDTLTIKDIKLLDMYDGSALVLIITDSGVIKDKEIKLPKIEDNYVEVANGLLAKSFAGKTLSQILRRCKSTLTANWKISDRYSKAYSNYSANIRRAEKDSFLLRARIRYSIIRNPRITTTSKILCRWLVRKKNCKS